MWQIRSGKYNENYINIFIAHRLKPTQNAGYCIFRKIEYQYSVMSTETPNDMVKRGVLDEEFMTKLKETDEGETFVYHGQIYTVGKNKQYHHGTKGGSIQKRQNSKKRKTNKKRRTNKKRKTNKKLL